MILCSSIFHVSMKMVTDVTDKLCISHMDTSNHSMLLLVFFLKGLFKASIISIIVKINTTISNLRAATQNRKNRNYPTSNMAFPGRKGRHTAGSRKKMTIYCQGNWKYQSSQDRQNTKKYETNKKYMYLLCL